MAGLSFVLCLFGSLLVRHLFRFRELIKQTLTAAAMSTMAVLSVHCTSLFISLPLCTESHKTTT